jgi:Sec-independent protein secretion pathway component TatC
MRIDLIVSLIVSFFLGAAYTFIITIPTNINFLPTHSQINHPTKSSWDVKGWNDDKFKVFKSAESALEYLKVNSPSQTRME